MNQAGGFGVTGPWGRSSTDERLSILYYTVQDSVGQTQFVEAERMPVDGNRTSWSVSPSY